MRTQTYTATLVVEQCCSCGVAFGLDRDHYQRLRDTHDWFYCPNGHSLHYTGPSDAEKLRRKLENEREETRIARADAEVERNRARAFKGHATRLRNRVGRGMCPCCSQEFPDVAAHIEAEHPGYTEGDLTEPREEKG